MPTTSPASFMDVLSEDQQRVFHKDMGCMTGILQIFDRHPALTAQRYSSRCNPNLHAQIMPTASGKPYHELRSNPAYDMAMDSSQRRTSVDTLEEQLKPAIMEDNTRSGIQSWETTSNKWTSVEKINSLSRNGDSYDRLNVDEEVVKHVQTTTTTTKPRLSFYIQENVPPPPPPPPPPPSSSFVAKGASLPSPSSVTAQSQNSKLSEPRQLGASLDEMLGGENKQSLNLEALEVKDVLCESLQHTQWSSVPLEKKNSTKDCDAELLLAPVLLSQVSFAFGHLKKSSTLVTGSGSAESELLLCEGRAAPQQQHELMAHSDLPYLCSAETRIGSADVYIDEGCQVQFLLDSMEKDLTMLANDNKLSNLWRSLEPKEVSRLTVELDDGPSISASSRNRHKMIVNAQGSQPPHMPLDNCHCVMKEEVRGDHWTPGFGFTDVLQSSQQGRDGGHPFAVEGCKDVLARVAAVTAASSSPGHSGNRSDNVGQKSHSFSVRGGGDHQENNVVARLMGLDKLPNFEQQKKTPPQKSLFCRTPPREVQLPNQPSPPLGVLPLTRVSDESSQMCNIRGSGSCHEAQMQEHRDRHTCEAQMMQEQRDKHPCEAQMVQERRDKHACEAQMTQERRDRHACEAQIMQEQKDRHASEAHHEVRSRSASCQSPKFMEGMPPLLFKQQDACNNNAMKSGNVPQTGKQFSEENAAAVQKLDFVTRQEPLSGDMAQRVRQLRLRNSVQERKTLKQILEAMQLKGLLHSPNHKQVQGLNSRSDPNRPPTESYLQPHCQEPNNQQTPISSKLTITILNNEDCHQAKHEHQETPRLLGSHEYYLANSNPRTHEEMITQGDEVEPQKIEPVSLLETDSQTVFKKRNDHRSSIVTMKPIKTKVGSLLQAPKLMSPPTSIPGAEIENGGGGIKNAQNKPRRAQVRTNNETLKDGQHMNRQQSPLRLLAPSYSSSSSSTTTATMKSPAREPPNNSTKSRSQYHRCAFGSGSTRMGEKKSLQGNLSLLKEPEECKLGRLGPSSSKTPKLKESLKKGKTNSLDPNTSRSGKSPSADAKLKTRILDNTARKSQRSSGAFVELASNKIKPSKTSSNNTMAQKFLKKQTPSKLCTNTVMGEEEDTGMDVTCQSWVQESANAAATVKVRIIEGEASDHSGDCSLNPENVLSVSSNMRSSQKSRELEMARAEVVKDKPATVDEEGDFRLQKKPPNFLIKKFELSENLPTVSATMEQPSPVSVLNNTAFEDEELIPSPQSCTTPDINLEVLSDDALERNNRKFPSLVDNVDLEEELAAAAAAAPATVRKKLCFEIDSSQQQQQQQQQLLLRPVKTSEDVEDDNDNIELLPFDSKNTTSSASTTSRSITGTSLKNKEDDRQFVHDSLVVVPDQLITKEVFLPEISTQQQHPVVMVPLVHTTPDTSSTTISIDPAMLIRLEQQWQRRKQEHNMSNNQQGRKHEEEHSSKEKKRKKKKKKEILDRRLLLDAFNEITSRKLPLFLNQDVPWTTNFAQQHQHQEQQQLVVSVQEPAMVRSFVKEVWDELRRIPCAQFDDDVHHTVQTVVRKDIGAKLQQSWSEFNVDVTEVGLELERRIFKELVKEVVAEFLWSQRPTTPTTSSTPTTTTTTMSTKTSMTTPTTLTTLSTPTTLTTSSTPTMMTTTMSTKALMTTPTTPTTTAIRVDVEQ